MRYGSTPIYAPLKHKTAQGTRRMFPHRLSPLSGAFEMSLPIREPQSLQFFRVKQFSGASASWR